MNDIFIEIQFIPPSKVLIVGGKLLCNGVELKINKTGFNLSGQEIGFSGNITGGKAGLVIGHSSLKAGFTIRDVDRY